RAWVVRTALNAGASWWRRRARELPLADHDVAAPGSARTGLDTVVLNALRRLPARQREVIVLRAFPDLDIEATARYLAGAPGTIRTASFTLLSNSNGTATLTINPKELLDPAALQSDLAQYGIPAKVTSGSFCTSDPHPAGFSQVVSFYPAGPGTTTPQSGVQPTITIDPSAMPAGAELSFGYFRLPSGEQQADVVLIDSNSYTCTSTPPDPNGPPGG